MKLSAPGKTFLVGEYLALDGGPSLILSTGPRFVLHLEKIQNSTSNSNSIRNRQPTGRFDLYSDSESESESEPKSAPISKAQTFHPDSPAGKFMARAPEFWSEWKLSFEDPHQGLGGLGASSAQFALLYAFQKKWHQKSERTRNSSSDQSFASEGGRERDWRELLRVYRECAWAGVGTPPSGADVVSQLTGGVTWFDGREFKAEKLAWEFPELSFTLIRTGVKLATHEHLQSRQSAPYSSLREIVASATQALQAVDEKSMIDSVQRYAIALDQAGLVAEGTKTLLKDLISQKDRVLAAKGCGAMGADVILVLHSKDRSEAIAEWAKSRSLVICGTRDDLSAGLEADPEF